MHLSLLEQYNMFNVWKYCMIFAETSKDILRKEPID